jgi:hypothetical protein
MRHDDHGAVGVIASDDGGWEPSPEATAAYLRSDPTSRTSLCGSTTFASVTFLVRAT